MRDENDGSIFLFLHFLDKSQNLRLYRYIQSRGGFVCNEKVRISDKSHRDHHALPHTTRKFKGIIVKARLRAGDSHFFQQLETNLFGFGTVRLLCHRSGSMICSPIFIVGFSELMGS